MLQKIYRFFFQQVTSSPDIFSFTHYSNSLKSRFSRLRRHGASDRPLQVRSASAAAPIGAGITRQYANRQEKKAGSCLLKQNFVLFECKERLYFRWRERRHPQCVHGGTLTGKLRQQFTAVNKQKTGMFSVYTHAGKDFTDSFLIYCN